MNTKTIKWLKKVKKIFFSPSWTSSGGHTQIPAEQTLPPVHSTPGSQGAPGRAWKSQEQEECY